MCDKNCTVVKGMKKLLTISKTFTFHYLRLLEVNEGTSLCFCFVLFFSVHIVQHSASYRRRCQLPTLLFP